MREAMASGFLLGNLGATIVMIGINGGARKAEVPLSRAEISILKRVVSHARYARTGPVPATTGRVEAPAVVAIVTMNAKYSRIYKAAPPRRALQGPREARRDIPMSSTGNGHAPGAGPR